MNKKVKSKPEKYRLIILDRLLEAVNSKCEGKKSIFYNSKRLSKLLSISINTIQGWYYEGIFPSKQNINKIEKFLLKNGDTMTDDRSWILEELWCFQEENKLNDNKLAKLLRVKGHGTLKSWRNGVLPSKHKIIERIRKILYVEVEKGLRIAKKYRNKKNKSFKSVYQINKNTNKIIQKFTSITEASKILNINVDNIGKVCRCVRKSAGGFKWEFYNKDDKNNKNRKQVYQIDPDTNEIIDEFNSIAEASKSIGISYSSIYISCNNNIVVCKYYKWRFVND